MKISLPEEVQYIISTFEEKGFEAYAVGGCVRDSLMGTPPADWDICTPALPEQMMQCFEKYHIIETGLKHGTITLRLNHKSFEITTYRVDGKYTDNRRPDNVRFVNVLKRDLARRDFTINAMAYAPKTGLVDYYGGREDLAAGVIKCVGNPDKRFGEDALRIMRALRQASVFGFEIESGTSDAIFRNKALLDNIASERIAAELNKLLTGQGAANILRSYAAVFCVFIPEIEAMIGFEQNNPYHYLDVWEHTLASISAASPDVLLRLTMLLHDIAKPLCYSESDGIGHFCEHTKLGSDMAGEILRRLKYPGDTISTVSQLVLYHDTDLKQSQRLIKRWLGRIGEARLRQLIEVKRADITAGAEEYRKDRLLALDAVPALIDEIIGQQQCFSLKNLAVNGRDMIDEGIAEGTEIGRILGLLLDMVIDEQLENNKDTLLEKARHL